MKMGDHSNNPGLDLKGCWRPDFFRLRAERNRLQKKPDKQRLEKLQEAISASKQLRDHRACHLPEYSYPDTLPVSERHAEIAAAIRQHQVVLVCGETGSGKTTQLPKICLEAGRGIDGVIGHTQPRRIAAQAISNRLAEELKTEVGGNVGFKVRFHDRSGSKNFIKVMTDGILLAELQHDHWLNQYDTLIIDEAHERSLNIDFLLGYFKQLLPKRKDLKLVITSATIDAERIAAHFDNAPVIEVSGRTYPVDMLYRPLHDPESDDDPLDLNQAIVAAIDETQQSGRGDVLVFLPGEGEIREVSRALRHLRDRMDVVPLYARLPPDEQKRVFHPGGKTRVILATNVAETSLTVPGIRYVIDSGQARLSRYSWRSKVQRLKIEKISQASANQRAGRCGRTGPGICIRLYDEEDFNTRQNFTDPEILRTNLAAVILQMLTIRLGNIEQFPFIDPPDPRLIKDGYRLLSELQATDAGKNLTALGKKLARLPIDPRLGRMLLAAEKTGAVTEVLAITTALAAQDPRDRPQNKQQAADEKHARFRDEKSDFKMLCNLWEYLERKSEELSHGGLRRLCQKEFFNHRRWREWHNLHRQVKLALKALKISLNTEPANDEAIHRALLSGLLDQIGFKDKQYEYLGCRNQRFFVFPGSGLHKKPPKWVMAAELTETTKLYARMVAGIQPQWLEQIGRHLLKHHYSEPHWQKKKARVGGYEKLTLCGLTVNPRRMINYAAVDPVIAREIFIHHALVEAEWHTRIPVIQENRKKIAAVQDIEAKTRRRDLLIDEQELFGFYERQLPNNITSGASFESWYKKLDNKDTLKLDPEKLLQNDADGLNIEQLPDSWQQPDLVLPLTYLFEPGDEKDGITLKIPLALLPQIDIKKTEWLVPGLLEEKILALIRSLPKSIRKQFVPAPDFAKAAVQRLHYGQGELLQVLTEALLKITGAKVPAGEWRSESLPDHLRMRFEVIDDSNQVLGTGRDLASLNESLQGKTRQRQQTRKEQRFEKENIQSWDFGKLPDYVEVDTAGYTMKQYPALVNEDGKLALRLFPTREAAKHSMFDGLLQLIRMQLKKQFRYLDKNLSNMSQHCLLFNAIARCEVLRDDLYCTAIRNSYLTDTELPKEQNQFNELLDKRSSNFIPEATSLDELLAKILPRWHAIHKSLRGNIPLNRIEAVADIKEQMGELIFPGFLLATPTEWLAELPRYLQAIEKRLQKLDQAPDSDRMKRVELSQTLERLHGLTAAEKQGKYSDYRWLIEELRVSLFAQELGTRQTVSVKRLDKLWQQLTA